MPAPSTTATFAIRDYDLAATLSSGQAFRWRQQGPDWIGVIGQRWVRLRAEVGTRTPRPRVSHGPEHADEASALLRGQAASLTAETAEPVADWNWLSQYLQLDVDLEAILRTFPSDEPMQAAMVACRGLRLLRQEPWECLASFILSSTKQILQIRQIISRLCECFGQPIAVPTGQPPARAFPTATRLAEAAEADLRACKMGFRAPSLLAAARKVTAGQLDLESLRALPLDAARTELMRLAGVGPKIANCVLLFSYDFPTAFPVDVWVVKALRQLYFRHRRVSVKQLNQFAASHFGPYAGYAQQYLFHYMRTRARLKP